MKHRISLNRCCCADAVDDGLETCVLCELGTTPKIVDFTIAGVVGITSNTSTTALVNALNAIHRFEFPEYNPSDIFDVAGCLDVVRGFPDDYTSFTMRLEIVNTTPTFSTQWAISVQYQLNGGGNFGTSDAISYSDNVNDGSPIDCGVTPVMQTATETSYGFTLGGVRLDWSSSTITANIIE